MYPGKTIKGFLYNIYDDNLYELIFDKNVIEILFNQLINSKISTKLAIPDEKFLGNFFVNNLITNYYLTLRYTVNPVPIIINITIITTTAII